MNVDGGPELFFLSGAFFPLACAPDWLGWIMRVNPMTYATAALRRVLYYHDAHQIGEREARSEKHDAEWQDHPGADGDPRCAAGPQGKEVPQQAA